MRSTVLTLIFVPIEIIICWFMMCLTTSIAGRLLIETYFKEKEAFIKRLDEHKIDDDKNAFQIH